MRISDWSSDVCSSDLESPNLAARLQGLAAPDSVVIDATTHSLAGSAFDCEDLGAQTMKGVMRPVAAWRVLRPRDLDRRAEAMQGDEDRKSTRLNSSH